MFRASSLSRNASLRTFPGTIQSTFPDVGGGAGAEVIRSPRDARKQGVKRGTQGAFLHMGEVLVRRTTVDRSPVYPWLV